MSGVLALRGNCSVKNSTRSAAKIFLLTLFWSAVSWPVLQLQHGEAITIGEWVSGVLTMELWRTNVFWFLPVLAILQIIRPVVCAVYDYDRHLFHYVLFGVLVISFGYDILSRCLQMMQWVLGSGAPMKLAGFIGLFRPFQGYAAWALGYYLLGMWISEHKAASGKYHNGIAIAMISLGSFTLAIYGLFAMKLTGIVVDVTFGGYGFVGTAMAVLGFYNILLSVRGYTRLEGIARFVGENSLAVYVLPWFVTFPLSQLILSFTSPAQRVAVAVLICLTLIAVAALLGRILTKTRIGKLLLST